MKKTIWDYLAVIMTFAFTFATVGYWYNHDMLNTGDYGFVIPLILLAIACVTVVLGFIKNEWKYYLIAATLLAFNIAVVTMIVTYIAAFKMWKRS